MTVLDAILKSLEELNKLSSSVEVFEHIKANNYCDFKGETPLNTVSAELGSFIRRGDSRVKRIKKTGGNYHYYLSSIESSLHLENLTETESTISAPKSKSKSFIERDLHKLLASYLYEIGIHCKTIYHEQSTAKDANQTWTHPDMVGLEFLKVKNQSRALLKSLEPAKLIKIHSYELKREINSDRELKEAFFQAVSNSSWANFGYLVALEFSDHLYEEIARLNEAFGIGIIQLSSYPYSSKVLFQPKYRNLDFTTIDKLCDMNSAFATFINQAEMLIEAEDRYFDSTKSKFEAFCDLVFANDLEVMDYCQAKGIPVVEWPINQN